jgi:DNA-binding MarR family transcriptional regulator
MYIGAVSDPDPTPEGAELLNVIARVNRWATYHAQLAISPALARLLAQIESLGPARVGDLARADHSSQPTMTAQVQRLAEEGLVAREMDPADGRAVLISLTAPGRMLLDEVRQARAAAIAPVLARMSDTERARIRDATGTLAELMRAASVTERGETALDPRKDPTLESL